jgi:V8-like Glu-specific endopeptidase
MDQAIFPNVNLSELPFGDEMTYVECYDSRRLVSREFIQANSPAVGQIQWLPDLPYRVSNPGNVTGVRWATGVLISKDLFLTAGHVFDVRSSGWFTPSNGGYKLSPYAMARLMRVNFNYQYKNCTRQNRTEDRYQIVDLKEYRRGNYDFAIVRLAPGETSRKYPGRIYTPLKIADQDFHPGITYAIIQHPHGREKMIEDGKIDYFRRGKLQYRSIDTMGGSSGAPIIIGEGSNEGEVTGVHTSGYKDTDTEQGYNQGISVTRLRRYSRILRSLTPNYAD